MVGVDMLVRQGREEWDANHTMAWQAGNEWGVHQASSWQAEKSGCASQTMQTGSGVVPLQQ